MKHIKLFESFLYEAKVLKTMDDKLDFLTDTLKLERNEGLYKTKGLAEWFQPSAGIFYVKSVKNQSFIADALKISKGDDKALSKLIDRYHDKNMGYS